MDGTTRHPPPENFIRDIIFILFKRLRLILVTALLVSVAATAGALYWPPVYGAFASIIVKGKRLDRDPGRLEQVDVRALPLEESDVLSEQSIIASEGLLKEVLDRLEQYGRSDLLMMLSDSPEKRIGALKSALTVRVVPSTKVIEVTLAAKDRDAALELLQNLFAVYPKFRERIYSSERMNVFLADQTRRLQQDLALKTEEAAAFLTRTGLANAEQQIEANLLLKRELEANLVTLEASTADLEGDVRFLNTLLASPDVARFASVRLADGTALSGRPEIAARVQQQSARLEVAQGNRQRIKDRIDRLDQDSLALRRNQLTYQTMEREVAVLGQAYQTMLTRHNEALINDPGGQEGNPYISVLVEPQPLHTPLFPNPRAILAVGLVAGLLLGVSLGFVRELFDRSFARPEDVQRILGVPVLFSIPDGAFADRRDRQSDERASPAHLWRWRALRLAVVLALLGTAGWAARDELPGFLTSLTESPFRLPAEPPALAASPADTAADTAPTQ